MRWCLFFFRWLWTTSDPREAVWPTMRNIPIQTSKRLIYKVIVNSVKREQLITTEPMNMVISCHLKALKTLCERFDHEHTIFWQSQNSFGYFTRKISVLHFSLELSTLIWCGWDQWLDYCLVVRGQILHCMLTDRGHTQMHLAKIKRMSLLTWRLWEDMLCPPQIKYVHNNHT